MQEPANKLLAVCIPTYNRAAKLREGIEKLLPLVRRHNIPVYVSDNASTDGTEAVVRELQASYPYLFYSQNPENYGADRNFEIVLKQPSAAFAWLLSDDDRLIDGALERALEIIQNGVYDLIIFNGGKLEDGHLVRGRVRDIPSRAYFDRNELLADLGWHTTWMSGLLFGQGLREGGNFSSYYQSSLLQVGVIFNYFADREPAVYWEATPGFFDASNGWAAWYSRAFEICVDNWRRVIDGLPNSYSETAKRTCIKAHGMKSGIFATISDFKRLRRMGYYNLDVYRRYRRTFPLITDIPPAILCCCAFWPNVAKLLYFCYRLPGRHHVKDSLVQGEYIVSVDRIAKRNHGDSHFGK